MVRLSYAICTSILVMVVGCASSHAVTPDSTTKQGNGVQGSRPPEQGLQHLVSRFQLVGGQQSDLFLVDTVTGCVWHQTQHPETKRIMFVEVDVENLHWSWGSGAQQILSGRIDHTELSSEQKGVLKATLQKTSCGQFNVIATPLASTSGEPGFGEKTPSFQQP